MTKYLVCLSILILSACGSVDLTYSSIDGGVTEPTVDSGPELSFDEQMFAICGPVYYVTCSPVDIGSVIGLTCKQLMGAVRVANPRLILSGDTIETCQRDVEISCRYTCN
jgi:hypothetical protein